MAPTRASARKKKKAADDDAGEDETAAAATVAASASSSTTKRKTPSRRGGAAAAASTGKSKKTTSAAAASKTPRQQTPAASKRSSATRTTATKGKKRGRDNIESDGDKEEKKRDGNDDDDEARSPKRPKPGRQEEEAGGGGDDEEMDEDEEMAEADAGEEDRKMPANSGTNGNRRSSAQQQQQQQQQQQPPLPAATATAAGRIPPVANLRMKSLQTPGKFTDEDYGFDDRLQQQQSANEMPMPSRKLVFGNQPHRGTGENGDRATQQEGAQDRGEGEEQQQQEGADDGEITLIHRARLFVSVSVPAGIASARGVATQVIESAVGRTPVDQDEDFVEGEVVDDSDDRGIQQDSIAKTFFPRMPTMFWFLVALAFQLAAFFCIRPIRLVHQSAPVYVLGGYQRLVGGADRSTSVVERIETKMEELISLTKLLKQYDGRVMRDLREHQNECHQLENDIRERKLELSETSEKLDSLATLFVKHLESGNIFSDEYLTEARDILGDSDPIVDLSFVENWEFPESPDCDFEPDSPLPIFASRADKLKEQAVKWAREAIVNPKMASFVRQKLRDTVIDEAPAYEAVLEKIESGDGDGGKVSLRDIHTTIDARFELERADQTGRIDYASIINGASVIRTGDRATTPSLSETLPVLNRVAAFLFLRFYGYGPEAALTPTRPPNALGQCWAFQKRDGNKHSAFAVLSIRLAKPIEVQRISIEHPPREVSDHVDSAIRTFRVLGFESPDAQGRAWALGSFEYKIDGDSFRQEFQAAERVKGDKIPVLSSVSVAIDSNWGSEYSCLYRVRVLGKERR